MNIYSYPEIPTLEIMENEPLPLTERIITALDNDETDLLCYFSLQEEIIN